jgi:hypothetical protein
MEARFSANFFVADFDPLVLIESAAIKVVKMAMAILSWPSNVVNSSVLEPSLRSLPFYL